mgnify:CR=1 FL=1
MTLNQLRKKLKKYNVIVTKADKDNSVFSIDRVNGQAKLQ